MTKDARITLIFDLGGTLIFDPFPAVINRLRYDSRAALEAPLLQSQQIESFLDEWTNTNRDQNFPYASHFMQEESFVASAAWKAFQHMEILRPTEYIFWQMKAIQSYRHLAKDVISQQTHLPQLKRALKLAKEKGFLLAVGSNDRYWAPAFMLHASGLEGYFDIVLSSEGLNFDGIGAEKPSASFFLALESKLQQKFKKSRTFYIGDDELRDVKPVIDLPITPVRFFGNTSASTIWLQNEQHTSANLSFANHDQLLELIVTGQFGNEE